MKRNRYNKVVNPEQLSAELITAIPALAPVTVGAEKQAVFGIETDATGVWLTVPDATSDAALQTVITAHVPVAQRAAPVPSGRVQADRVIASLTLVNVQDLSFPVAPGEPRSFKMFLHVGSSTAAGFKVGFAPFAGAAFKALVRGNSAANSTFAAEVMTAFGAAGSQVWCAAINALGWMEIAGIVRAPGSGGGLLQLQAQKVTGGNCTFFADSFIETGRIGG